MVGKHGPNAFINFMSAASAVNTQYNNIVNASASSDSVSGPQQTLSQNDFLKLLVAQMENQDPLQPQSDTEMASQMAQFTSLTQTTAMSSSLSAMQANSLIGATVVLQEPNSQQTTSGVVQSVLLGAESSDGAPQIVVNGTAYDLSQVLTVTPTTTSTTSTQTPTSTTN
jgi:flagellar hook assembly protein FlgD